MSRLVLDRSHLTAMLRADDFYRDVPEFNFLRPSVQEAWQMYLNNRDCQRCFQEWYYMKGVIDAAFLHLKKLKDAESPVLSDIKAWFSKRKGYTVSTVMLYYRSSSAQRSISKFTF